MTSIKKAVETFEETLSLLLFSRPLSEITQRERDKLNEVSKALLNLIETKIDLDKWLQYEHRFE